jgi:glutaredoxin 3
MDNIIIYTKKECLYCVKAKQLLNNLNLTYTETIMNPNDDDYKKIVDTLKKKYYHNTFPFIIINDIFIGGFTELEIANNTMYLQKILNNKNNVNNDCDF